MDSKELCAWLRENSSGAYRPAADAADLIERLESAATLSPVPAEQDDDAMIVKAVQDAKVWCVVPTADTTRDIGRVVLAAERKRVAELVPAEPATAELPPLPNTNYNGYSDGSEPLYTADQMRERDAMWAEKLRQQERRNTILQTKVDHFKGLSSRPAPVAVVPEGFALVPLEPTDQMCWEAEDVKVGNALWDGSRATASDSEARAIWKKMIAAAPSQPDQSAQEVKCVFQWAQSMPLCFDCEAAGRCKGNDYKKGGAA